MRSEDLEDGDQNLVAQSDKNGNLAPEAGAREPERSPVADALAPDFLKLKKGGGATPVG